MLRSDTGEKCGHQLHVGLHAHSPLHMLHHASLSVGSVYLGNPVKVFSEL